MWTRTQNFGFVSSCKCSSFDITNMEKARNVASIEEMHQERVSQKRTELTEQIDKKNWKKYKKYFKKHGHEKTVEKLQEKDHEEEKATFLAYCLKFG
jgi:transcriptional regulator of heat shock response